MSRAVRGKTPWQAGLLGAGLLFAVPQWAAGQPIPGVQLCDGVVCAVARQEGSGNDVVIDQTRASPSRVTVEQTGVENQIEVTATGQFDADLSQNGLGNEIVLDGRNVRVEVSQDGVSNSANFQIANPGAGLVGIDAFQNGARNTMDIRRIAEATASFEAATGLMAIKMSQEGNGNAQSLTQDGIDLSATLSQIGNRNSLDVTQTGSGLGVEATQIGNGLSMGVNQIGAGAPTGAGVVTVTQY